MSGLAMSGAVVHAQTAPAQSAPKPAGPLLGRGHLWLKIGEVDLDDAAAEAWGVDHQTYLGLEGYRGFDHDFYFGGEFGHAGAGTGMTESGDTLRDVDFWWLEMNEKKAFNLRHGLSFDAGLGLALFFVEGQEVTTLSGLEFSSPLADIGLGAQIFADFNWRTRRLLLGLDAKYQWAFDVIDIDYSNLRLGAHVGVAF